MLCSHNSDWRFCDKSLFPHEYSLKRRGCCSAPRQNSSSHATAAVGRIGIGLSSSKSIFDSQHTDKWGKYQNDVYEFVLIYIQKRKEWLLQQLNQSYFLFFSNSYSKQYKQLHQYDLLNYKLRVDSFQVIFYLQGDAIYRIVFYA